jgi:hypothetical protein
MWDRQREGQLFSFITLCASLLAAPLPGNAGAPTFTDVTDIAGVAYVHGDAVGENLIQFSVGGAAAGDYDRDGWLDLFAVSGDRGANRLFRNLGNGRFAEVGAAAGVAQSGRRSSGPTFADYDGDGDLDLLVGAVDNRPPALFQNRDDGTFATADPGPMLLTPDPVVSSTFGDYDRDGDLDLLLSRWGIVEFQDVDYLWRNNGDGTFAPVTDAANLTIKAQQLERFGVEWTLSPNFADINNDAWLDILFASDFGTSQVFLNNQDGTFRDVTDATITDENGMGTAIADYDADGDLDWFVTSIFELDGIPSPERGVTGNRMYRNRGDGTFEDATDAAGVRDGNWGWASCFGDFDNDGYVDIFHVNGWITDVIFEGQPARLFMNQGDATFIDQAEIAGVDDRHKGIGVVCFDYDRDGDLDIFVANNDGPSRLFRNDTGNQLNHLHVRLRGRSPNTQGIGGRIYVTTGSRTQMHELRAGTNYVSQDPAEAQFGLGTASSAEIVRVVWPDRSEGVLTDVPANRFLIVDRDAGDANCDQRATAADLVRSRSLASALVPAGCPFADTDGDGTVEAAETDEVGRYLFAAVPPALE